MNARIAPPTDLPQIDADAVVRSARTVIATEAAAIRALEPRIDANFVEACRLILQCRGRVIVSGMGKSGHIARKIAATLASTGTPAFFVHPGEASHGDLGMILPEDVVMALSYSGETDELLFILPVIKRQGIPLIAIALWLLFRFTPRDLLRRRRRYVHVDASAIRFSLLEPK